MGSCYPETKSVAFASARLAESFLDSRGDDPTREFQSVAAQELLKQVDDQM